MRAILLRKRNRETLILVSQFGVRFYLLIFRHVLNWAAIKQSYWTALCV